MRLVGRLLSVVAGLVLLCPQISQTLKAQVTQNGGDGATFQLNSTLVFLDVTVVDKQGRVVTKGLSKDDFTITEDSKPQRIFSFEAPQEHDAGGGGAEDGRAGKAPVSIFVLDRLNSSIDEFEQLRKALHSFLAVQPPELESPAELMVIGNTSLEMAQGYTRSRDDLLYAVDRVQTVIPFKLAKSDFDDERAKQSIEALDQIVMQNKGVPGRKNVFWMGPGGPTLSRALGGPQMDNWQPYVHAAANRLVAARISLFVVFPQMKTTTTGTENEVDQRLNVGNNGPFTGDVNFAMFAKETGGGLFYNRNDLDTEVKESHDLGEHYYTLSYRPSDQNEDGKFRNIHVALQDHNLRALTKEGYFALNGKMPVDAQQQTVMNIVEAAQSKLTFDALQMSVSDVVRHEETRTVQFTVHLKAKNLGWVAGADGKKNADLVLAMMSLAENRRILASKFEKVNLHSSAADPDQLTEEVKIRLTALLPHKTESVRVVLETAQGGRMGAVDVAAK